MSGNRAIMPGVSVRAIWVGSLAVAAIGGALNGCGRPLIPGSPGAGGSTAPGATAGSGGVSGSGGGAGVPACPSLLRGGACTPADPQVCYKTCGPEKTGTKSLTCQRDGTYLESPICSYDASKDYSCYAIPSTVNAACPPGEAPQGSMACNVDHCVLCNSAAVCRAASIPIRRARPRSATAPASCRTPTVCGRGPAPAKPRGRARWASAVTGRQGAGGAAGAAPAPAVSAEARRVLAGPRAAAARAAAGTPPALESPYVRRRS